MENLLQRDYYKIFTGPEQNGGFENIFLGYEAYFTEQRLQKDKTTTFNMPFYTKDSSNFVHLSACGLIEDGATAGPSPIISDKLYTIQRNHGNSTPWGNTIYSTRSTLHCTWLYSFSGEAPVWVDRYYTPGAVSASNNLLSDIDVFTFQKDPRGLIYDVVSDRVLEPGVMYRYTHVGEKHAQSIVDTLSGYDDIYGLRLNVNKWSINDIRDESIFNNPVHVFGDTVKSSLQEAAPGEVDRYYLNLNNEDVITYVVPFSEIYNTSRNYSMMIWVRSEDWGNVNYSTIFGNMYNGGYALRFNNLKYTPYFFIAEKTYNNVICFNQNLKPYLTSNLFANYLSNITTYTVDGNRDLIVLDNVLKKIYKLDHLCSSKNLIFDFAEEVEDVSSLNLYYVYANRYNNYYVTTSNGVYEIDNELLTCTNINRECNQYTRIAFGFDKRMAVVQDARCAHYTKNNILLSVDLRGNLIINNDVAKNAYEYPNIVSFNIDPEGYVWLMFGVNVIAKVIIKGKTIEKVVSYIIGGVNYRKSVDIRHITFIHRQTRTGTREWYAVSYSNIDKFVHYFTKDLVEIDADNIQWLTGVIDVSQSDVIISCDPCALDVDAPQEAAMTLCDSTDISGYNWSRVNDYILYDDIEQLQFKVSLKNIKTKSFKIFTMSVPRTLLYNQYWQHISVMFNGEVFTLFIDGVAHTTMEMPSGYFINYSTCHSTYIGTTTGKFKSLNDEIKITQLNFNASVDDLRIYNYQIDQNLLLLFRRAYFYGKDMLWNIPTAPIQYIDGIERLFQHKIPGSVSNFYKLKVKNFKLNTNNQEDEQEIKDIIEEVLTENVSKVQPAHTELLSVEWD